MDQINDLQKWVGEPVIGFAQQHWWWLIVIGLLGVAWFFGWGRSDGAGVTIFIDGRSNDGESGGDGGGGDGGGGD
jgi:hypothetical protein